MIWQEHWLSHFASNESLKLAGILDVFQELQTAQLREKGQPGPQTQFCGVGPFLRKPVEAVQRQLYQQDAAAGHHSQPGLAPPGQIGPQAGQAEDTA